MESNATIGDAGLPAELCESARDTFPSDGHAILSNEPSHASVQTPGLDLSQQAMPQHNLPQLSLSVESCPHEFSQFELPPPPPQLLKFGMGSEAIAAPTALANCFQSNTQSSMVTPTLPRKRLPAFRQGGLLRPCPQFPVDFSAPVFRLGDDRQYRL